MPARAFGRRARSAATPVARPAVAPVPAPRPAGAPRLNHSGTGASPPPPVAPADPTAARRRVPSPTADGAIAEVVARIHPAIVKSLDMSRIADVDNETLATQLLAFLETGEADTADLSPIDRQRVVTQLVHDIKGLGPIEPLLQDPDISDILINGVSSTYVERRGRLEPVDIRFRDAQHLVHIAQRIAGRIGRRIDESSPMVDARLPDGSRVNIIIPPLVARRGRDLHPPLRDAGDEPRRDGRAPGALTRDGRGMSASGSGRGSTSSSAAAPGRARPRS